MIFSIFESPMQQYSYFLLFCIVHRFLIDNGYGYIYVSCFYSMELTFSVWSNNARRTVLHQQYLFFLIFCKMMTILSTCAHPALSLTNLVSIEKLHFFKSTKTSMKYCLVWIIVHRKTSIFPVSYMCLFAFHLLFMSNSFVKLFFSMIHLMKILFEH